MNQSATDQFNNKRFLYHVANRISNMTAIKHGPAKHDGESIIIDFLVGNSYLTNNGGTSLFFAYVTPDGVTESEINETNTEDFVRGHSYTDYNIDGHPVAILNERKIFLYSNIVHL